MDTLCTGWYAEPQISVLSAQVLMHMGGGRGCYDYCVCASSETATHLYLSRLDKTTGRDGDRSAALKITLALAFPHQMQIITHPEDPFLAFSLFQKNSS